MKQPAPKALSAAQRRYVLGSVLVTGGAVLVLEIVGTRVISPFYGSSLYTWSALITVTLIALAAGYNLGGRFADRSPSLTLFARVCCLAGAAVAVVPTLRIPVLKMTAPLGVQIGALSSATVLVAPALVLLGVLGPLAIKLTTEGMASVGRSAGDVYAVSTLGSVLGAVLAGFVLIPQFSISHIFYGTACLLLLLGALGYHLSQQKLPVAQIAAAAAVGLFGFWPRTLPETNILVNIDSPYGQIKVLDFADKRYLLVNGTTQSVARVSDFESDSQYAHSLEWAALLRPKAQKALVIGIGAGLLSGALERHYGLTTDTVDIDPDVVRTARRYFRFSPRGQVSVEDGRTYLERGGKPYGLIFLDAFGSDLPPYHLLTAEAFQAMRRSLEPGGILAVNIVTVVNGAGNDPWRSAYKTLRSVCPEVRAFVGSDTYDDLGNVVFFCSDSRLEDRGEAGTARELSRPDLVAMLARELKPSPEVLASAVLMTDDHAPMEFLMAKTAARWRKGLQEKVSEILLY